MGGVEGRGVLEYSCNIHHISLVIVWHCIIHTMLFTHWHRALPDCLLVVCFVFVHCCLGGRGGGGGRAEFFLWSLGNLLSADDGAGKWGGRDACGELSVALMI